MRISSTLETFAMRRGFAVLVWSAAADLDRFSEGGVRRSVAEQPGIPR